jgi:hypothetical protein
MESKVQLFETLGVLSKNKVKLEMKTDIFFQIKITIALRKNIIFTDFQAKFKTT